MIQSFEKIAVIGLGLIGGSIAKALKTKDESIFIGAYDRPEILDRAINENTINAKIGNFKNIDEYDVIFLCLPVDTNLKIMKEIAPILSEKNIITDVSGVKGVFCEEWKKLNSKGIYFGGHPMTGKEKDGYINSDPLLFENAVYILSNGNPVGEINKRFYNLIKSLGAKIVKLDPYLHDEIVANVSHVPQLLSVALINSSSKISNDIKFTDFGAGGFRDMTRIASSKFNIWESIIELNREKIIAAIDDLRFEIDEMRESIISKKSNKLKALFEKARYTRDEIPANTKGFLYPLHDLFVFVKDEPGIISKISTSLFNININIKDIELLKIREGDGGVFRLSFDSESDVEMAAEVLKELGFSTK